MRSDKKNLFKIIVVFSILIAIIITSRNLPSPLRIAFTDIATPFLDAYHSIAEFSEKILPFAAFREENRILRERIALLNRKIEESKVLYDENQRLKEFLDFRKIVPYATIPSQVIGRDPSNWSNSLIIDKGQEDGISQGRAVLSTKGLVGRVVEVGRYSSKVLLISDANSKVGVLVVRNRHGGILVGRPDGKCKMIYIALDSDTAKGDIVMTAGYSAIFPQNILVGEITSVGKEPGRLYKYAIVKPAQDLSKMEEVLCIK